MRYFNTYGPVNEQQHYVVARNDLVEEIVLQVNEGRYFTIYAPRQMGKTTLLQRLQEKLNRETNFLILTFSFESSEGAPVAEFWDMLYQETTQRIWQHLRAIQHPQAEVIEKLLGKKASEEFYAYRTLLVTLCQLTPLCQVVLVIDEFDGTPAGAIVRLLQTWREIYLTQPQPRGLQSVILIGLQNIAKLNLGRSSPFNIARQIQLNGFTLPEIQILLDQYTAETSQTFAADILEKIYQQTGGQPFLVNRLLAIVTGEIATDRQVPVRQEEIETARNRLVRESNYNFETLIRHANEHPNEVLQILFGKDRPFNLNDPLIRDLHTNGIVSATTTQSCQIANPVYSVVLLSALQPSEISVQGATIVNGYDFRPHVVNGELQIGDLLSRFRQFIERRGREAFKVTTLPHEAVGQYMLMAYLEIVVRQLGGDLFTEVYSGEGRMDLLIVRQGRRYVVETKIWRGPTRFDAGLDQLQEYLAQEGENEGYYVVFHARPRVYGKLPYEEMEFTKQHKGATIHVYLVRLGELLEKPTQRKPKAAKQVPQSV